MSADRTPTRRLLFLPGPDGAVRVTDSDRSTGFQLPAVYTEELWETASPADLSCADDLAPPAVTFPRAGRVVVRLLELRPPDSAVHTAREQESVQELMDRAGGGATQGDLHWTQTTDYFSVLSGRVTLAAEGEEAALGPGDLAVCLGALHGWRCHPEGRASIFTVLIGAADRGDAGSADFVAHRPPSHDRAPAARRVVLGHDPGGRARILDDQQIPVPWRAWQAEAPVPTNRVTADQGSTAGSDPGGLGFDIADVHPEGPIRLGGSDRLVTGIVLAGSLDLTPADADQAGSASTLSTGDVFVSNGFRLRAGTTGAGGARLSYVSVPGVR